MHDVHGMEEVIGSIPIRSTKQPYNSDMRSASGRFELCLRDAVLPRQSSPQPESGPNDSHQFRTLLRV